jgi:predicted dehydrogenase
MVFADGCTVNLTASRISAKAERRMRLFQRDRYFSIDFVTGTAREYVAETATHGETAVRERALDVTPTDALEAELAAFLHAVATGGPAPVSGADGLRSMELAERVMQDIARNVLP